MKKSYKFLILILIMLSQFSCSKEEKVTVLKSTNLETQMIDLYNEAYDEFLKGDTLFAAQKFNEAEIIFPQSDWAPLAALMSAYVYYSDDYYSDAIYHLERFLKVYPNHKDQDYAHFLLAMCYYSQVSSIGRDPGTSIEALNYFSFWSFSILIEVIL